MPEPSVRVDVALVPELMGRVSAAAVYVAVDVIRATTTLSVCFERGCRRVLVAVDIPSARAARERLAREHPGAPPLLGGEAGGVAPVGFDVGNSPAELAARELAGREIVFATTNGTRALRACAGGGAIFAGAPRNASAVMGAALAARRSIHAAAEAKGMAPARGMAGGLEGSTEAAAAGGSGDEDEAAADVVIVCAGRGRRPAYDDTLCAGVLVMALARQVEAAGTTVRYSEGARIARGLAERAWGLGAGTWEALGAGTWEALGAGTWEALGAELARSDAAEAIQRVGLGGDLAWCAAVDVARVAPRVVGMTADGLLVLAADGDAGGGEQGS